MSALQPVNPHYTSGQVVSPAAGSANVAINATDKQVILTNLGANVCYIRISADAATTATTADYPVPAGAQVTITKGEGQNRLAHISAAGTTLHIMTGEGW